MTDSLSPERIEKDIEADRSALADTLDALTEHVSIDRWITDATQSLQSGGGELADTVRRTARNNPGALVAAGAGLALVAYGISRVAATPSPSSSPRKTDDPIGRFDDDGNSLYRGYDAGGYAGSRGRVQTPADQVVAESGADPLSPEFDARLRDADSALRESEPRLAEERADAWASDPWGTTGEDPADTTGDMSLKRRAADTVGKAQEALDSHATAMRARFDDGLETFNDEARSRILRARAHAYEAQRAVEAAAEKGKGAFQKHPLAFGIGAVALGAVAAALLPRSDEEQARRSAQRDALLRKARSVYAEEKRKVSAAARAATSEAKHQVREAIDAATGETTEPETTATRAAEKIGKAAHSAYKEDAAASKPAKKSAKSTPKSDPASAATAPSTPAQTGRH